MRLLVAVNVAGGLFFITTPEGQAVLIAGFVSMLMQVAIFANLGYVKLLGLGHLPWVPLLIWLVWRLQDGWPDSFFEGWLWVLIALNGISLVIDTFDVARYLLGERAPVLERAP